uniref:Uncharacterized protein n=1 Tax=Oryzias sinensis TaxID=183150 RepID=A0A8C7YPV0_9TELE
MPFVELQTNLPGSSFKEDFLRKLCSCVASTLSKPEEVRGRSLTHNCAFPYNRVDDFKKQTSVDFGSGSTCGSFIPPLWL